MFKYGLPYQFYQFYHTKTKLIGSIGQILTKLGQKSILRKPSACLRLVESFICTSQCRRLWWADAATFRRAAYGYAPNYLVGDEHPCLISPRSSMFAFYQNLLFQNGKNQNLHRSI
jgi:hypothetical protein